jgi:hypothetical protein
VEFKQLLPIWAEFGATQKQERAGEVIRAMQLEILGHDSVIPPQPQPAEFDVPTLFRELPFQPGFHPVRKPDVIQEQAQDQDDEDQQEKRDSAPFESGEEDSQAARADFFPLRSIP